MPASKIVNADERNGREKRRKNTLPDVPKDKLRQETDKVQLHRQNSQDGQTQQETKRGKEKKIFCGTKCKQDYTGTT